MLSIAANVPKLPHEALAIQHECHALSSHSAARHDKHGVSFQSRKGFFLVSISNIHNELPLYVHKDVADTACRGREEELLTDSEE